MAKNNRASDHNLEGNDEQEFSICPDTFMKGITIVPFNFDMPEKAIHGSLVNSQLRSDLFNMTYNKIKGLLYSKLKNENEYFRLKSIDKISCDPHGTREVYLTKKYKAHESDRYLSCEEWTIDMNGKTEFKYKVKSMC